MELKENILFHDRYRLIKLLGRGGFSEVWLVEDAKTNMIVVLKVYAPGTGLDEDGAKLFSQEFSLVYNFNHSNLLKPTHFDICDRRPYLTLPFCERGSALKLAGRIAEEEAWKFLHDVASGLAYLHRQNPPVIHQDIKPDNVLMDNTGQFMITDFGISTKVRSTLRKSVGQQNVSGGTLAYMGPERFSRDNTPIKAGDIWALGATLYELFVGDTPFGDHGGVIQKSGAEIPNIKGNMSPDLMHIVNLCLQKETWDRPTAETIIAWTEQHSRGEKINFGKLPQPPKPKKPSKPTPPPKPATPSKPTVAGEKKSVLKNVLLIIAGSIVGLLIIFFIAGKTFAPSEEQLRDFEKYKNAAITNYDFAKKLGDKFSYQEALKNCTKALSIKKDDELKKMKQDIETELELKQ